MVVTKLIEWLKYTGLWIPTAVTSAVAGAMYYMGYEFDINTLLQIFGCSHILPLYIWSLNIPAKRNGVTSFPLFPSQKFISTHPDWQISYRDKAFQKEISRELISKKPEGIILGKQAGKYVRVIPGKKGASHTLILGGSGSGKSSSVILTSLLANAKMKEPITYVVVDVKGELYEKGFPDKSKIKVFNPRDRSQCGFDFLYDISDSSSEEEVLSTMRRVVYALFPQKQNGDSFWTDSARAVCLGLFHFAWLEKEIRTLPDLVDFILSKNLKELINEVVMDVDEYSIISKLLISFAGEDAADETLSSISMNLLNGLNLLASDESLRYLLRESKHKITPELVDQGISIDLQIEDQYLDQYAPIFNLCISTCISHILKRKESNNRPACLLLDELGRIANSSGQIGYGSGSLQAFLEIARGVNAFCMLALQSWSALDGIYAKGALQDMLSNLQYRLILQATPEDEMVVSMVIKAFGKFTERKKSVNMGKQQTSSYSFEEKDIIQPTDLLTLPDQNRAILLSPYGAFRITKCQYFKDPILKKLQQINNKQRRKKLWKKQKTEKK